MPEERSGQSEAVDSYIDRGLKAKFGAKQQESAVPKEESPDDSDGSVPRQGAAIRGPYAQPAPAARIAALGEPSITGAPSVIGPGQSDEPTGSSEWAALSTDESAEKPEIPPICRRMLFGGSVFIRSDLNKRENNEDAFLAFEMTDGAGSPLRVLIIADGMGGYEHGELVSREAIKHFATHFFQASIVANAVGPRPGGESASEYDVPTCLWQAVVVTNSYVQRMVEANKWHRAGSTIVACAIKGATAYVVNLGDSPLFHLSPAEGKLSQVTEDHTVAGAFLRQGVITPEMARVHADRSKLEFYLGGSSLPKSPATYQFELAPGDLIMLCTDGVSSEMPPTSLEGIVVQGETLPEITETLFEMARALGETDNQTVILYRHAVDLSGVMP